MVAGLLIAAVVYIFRDIVLLACLGFGIGTLLSPAVDWMQAKLKAPRFLSSILMFVCLISLLSVLGYFLYGLLVSQFNSLMERAPAISAEIQRRLPHGFDGKTWISDSLMEGARAVYLGVRLGIEVLTGIVVVLSVSVFTTIHSHDYFAGLLTLFHGPKRARAKRVLEEVATQLRSWAMAQGIAILIIAGATTFGYWLIGIDYWLLFGILTGALDVVPFFGPVFATLIAALVTLSTNPDKVWWILLLAVIIQQLEGHVLLPVIMKRRVQLPEAHLILFLLMVMFIFGWPGAIIGTPIFAALRVLYLRLWVERSATA